MLAGRAYDQPWRADGIVDVDLDQVWTFTGPQHRFCFPEQYTGDHRTVRMFNGGRSAGKTHVLGRLAIILALRNPGCPGLVGGRVGRDCSDKILPQILNGLREFRDATGIDLCPSGYNRAEAKFELINGSTILLRTYGRNSTLEICRGYDVAWFLLDEIENARVDGGLVLDTLLPCVRHPDTQYPVFAAVSTPNGLRGFVARIRQLQAAEDKGDEESAISYCVTAPSHSNPYQAQGALAAIKAGSSNSSYRQEILAEILAPTGLVYSSFAQERHVIPWEWDPHLPYMIAVDPGVNHAYWCAVQYLPEVRPKESPHHELPDGAWVVAHEVRMDRPELSDQKFLKSILKFVEGIEQLTKKTPSLIVSDRALPAVKNQLRHHLSFKVEHGIRTLDSRKEYGQNRGIAMVDSLLDPLNAAPRLYFSSRLSKSLEEDMGLIGSMLSYRWRVAADGAITNVAHKDNVSDHAADALRYLVVKSKNFPDLHGGRQMPFLIERDRLFQDEQSKDREFALPRGKTSLQAAA